MNRYLKRLFYYCLELSGCNALFRRRNKGRLKTLMYHSISPDGASFFPNANSATDFERQLRYLKRHYALVGLTQDGEITGCRADRVNVLLTFDDGFRDNHEVAFPLLARHGVKGCFFLIADCLEQGSVPGFAHKYIAKSGVTKPYSTLTAAQAREMGEHGMTLASHGKAHLDYSKATVGEGVQDASEAKLLLERLLECEIGCFAYPWGRRQPGQTEELQGCYRRIFSTEHGFNDPGERLLGRNEVSGFFHMCAASSGALDFFAALLGLRRAQ